LTAASVAARGRSVFQSGEFTAVVAVLGMALALDTWPVPHASVGGAPRLPALHLPGGLLGLIPHLIDQNP
jgi:hypothetical protein